MKKSILSTAFLMLVIAASGQTQKASDHLHLEGDWCKGNYSLIADTDDAAGIWQWTLNGKTLEKETGPQVNMANYGAGKYEVSFISDTDELVLKDSFSLETLPGPKADFNYDYYYAAGAVQFTNITATSDSNMTWTWDFGDGTTSNKKSADHMYKEEGTYLVQLTATNSQGCASVVSTSIVWEFPKR